jgi:ABC-type transport system involved in multi-copper enzyme maturation permease subunit
VNSKAIIKAEILSGLRNYRFLIVFAVFLFLAVMTPIMTKLVLPGIFRSSYPDMSPDVLEAMFNQTHAEAVRAYLGDIFEIGTLIIAFLFAGLIAQEISEKTLILPVCTGKRYGEILIAKLLVNGTAVMLATTIAAMANYYYAGLMFGFRLQIVPVLRAGLFLGLYMAFVLAAVMLFGALTRKHILSGMLALISAYGLVFVGNLLRINRFLPSGLLAEAQTLSLVVSTETLQSTISTLALMVIFVSITAIRLSKMELAQG